MHNSTVQGFILAAGSSSRFKTPTTKLSFKLCGQELITYPVTLLRNFSIPITLIIGHQKEHIQAIFTKAGVAGLTYCEQHEQRGTGHAILCSRTMWYAENILILGGDAPLVTQGVIRDLLETHQASGAALTFVVAHNSDPLLTGYGRVVHDSSGISIIEAQHFVGDTTQHCCVNAGIYLIKREMLEFMLPQLEPNGQTGELYITDLISLISHQGHLVKTITAPFDQIRGINTLRELWIAEHIKRSELIGYWMDNGVRFLTPQTSHIDSTVTIGAGTVIGAGVILTDGTRIGANCSIDAFSVLSNSIIHDNVIVKTHSVISDSEVLSHAHVGPFAHIHNKSTIGERACIGNFVEVTRSSVGLGTKAKHLTYLGDAQLGSHVNIGAGTIIANYDGVYKHQTIINDKAHIGSNNSLVAPLTIGANAVTGAGSVITENVPDNALALGRARQVIKEQYIPHPIPESNSPTQLSPQISPQTSAADFFIPVLPDQTSIPSES